MSAADLRWARSAKAGDYLHEWDDDNFDEFCDPGSRGGRSDAELDEIGRILGERGLRLVADDRGLVAARREVRS